MNIAIRTMWAAALFVTGLGGAALGQNPFEPTAEHKMLAEEVGSWDAEIKMWMQGPEAAPDVSKGSETIKAVGDLWTVSDFSGEIAGQPFSGHGITGYDPSKKKLVGIWIDTMSVAPIELEGTYDAASKTVTMTAEGVDPATKQPYKMKQVATRKDKDHRSFTMYMTMPGGGDEMVKSMEISYTRKK